MMAGMGEPRVDEARAVPSSGVGEPEPAPAAVVDDVDAAFDRLYEREYAPMLRLAVLLVDSREQAEEAVHDAFARVYERWTKLDRPGAYLRTCVVNRCRDVQRRRRFERGRRADTTEPSSELGADELLDALRQLPPKRRAALVLRYYEDLSEADIADALGVRPGTVKSLLSRGLDQLREVIER
jgi:RNA polymerase sigma-70 factor (sigma-E family)